jgi:hypothetical protein
MDICLLGTTAEELQNVIRQTDTDTTPIGLKLETQMLATASCVSASCCCPQPVRLQVIHFDKQQQHATIG